MAKRQNKGTLLRDALVLCVITLISGLLVAFFYELTKEPIAANEAKTKAEAFAKIYGAAETFDSEPAFLNGSSAAEFGEAALAADGGDFGNVTVDEITGAFDADGAAVGYIVSVTTGDGYDGDIGISVGVNPDGQIAGVEILSISETAGLGMKAREADFRNQYAGKAVERFAVTKQEPKADSEIAAISGATITSEAVTNAVNAALAVARSIPEQ